MRPRTLPKRVALDERVELGHESVVLTERKPCVEPFLQRGQPQLFEPLRFDAEERLVGDVGESRPAPEVERTVERGERLGGIPRGVRLPPSLEVLLEAVHVDVTGGRAQHVTA